MSLERIPDPSHVQWRCYSEEKYDEHDFYDYEEMEYGKTMENCFWYSLTTRSGSHPTDALRSIGLVPPNRDQQDEGTNNQSTICGHLSQLSDHLHV